MTQLNKKNYMFNLKKYQFKIIWAYWEHGAPKNNLKKIQFEILDLLDAETTTSFTICVAVLPPRHLKVF